MELENGLHYFHLMRWADPTGISGTGRVAIGACLKEDDEEYVVLVWKTKYESAVTYVSMEKLMAVHCHEGKSGIIWADRLEWEDAFALDAALGQLKTVSKKIRKAIS